MAPLKNILPLTAFFASAYAGLDTGANSNLALYWGQNSYGKGEGDLAQQPLGYYCESADVDSLQLSFATTINGVGGVPQVNFANTGDECEKFEGTDLLDCPKIGADIKKCQENGKTIILSIGGATYSEGGFQSEADAVAGADLIWKTFGPAGNDSDAKRPFHDAAVDGFDLDFEAVVSNMVPFANRLRELMDGEGSKKYFLTAAPQCPYPDQNNKEMLDGAVSFDAIFIQFYNNFCGVNAWQPGNDSQFNLNVWDEWAKNTSKNKDVKLLVGAPANTGAAGSGYVDAAKLAEITKDSKKYKSFGGVMLWDASQAWANDGFVKTVKEALKASASRIKGRRSL